MPPKRLGRYLIKSSTSAVAKRKRITPTQIKRTYQNKVVLLKQVNFERKWYQIGYANVGTGAGTPWAINPFYLLSQGVTQDSRVGLNVSDVNLYLDINYTHLGCDSLATVRTNASRFRVIVFTNPSKWHQTVYNVIERNTAGTGTVIPTSDVFLDSGNDRMTHSYLNKDVNKILYDSGPLVVNQGGAASSNSVVGAQRTHKCKIKVGDLRWEYNTNSYLRDSQVYVWVVADYQGYGAIAPANSDNLGNVGVNFLVTFQDS